MWSHTWNLDNNTAGMMFSGLNILFLNINLSIFIMNDFTLRA